jgi:hypothetical protein
VFERLAAFLDHREAVEEVPLVVALEVPEEPVGTGSLEGSLEDYESIFEEEKDGTPPIQTLDPLNLYGSSSGPEDEREEKTSVLNTHVSAVSDENLPEDEVSETCH